MLKSHQRLFPMVSNPNSCSAFNALQNLASSGHFHFISLWSNLLAIPGMLKYPTNPNHGLQYIGGFISSSWWIGFNCSPSCMVCSESAVIYDLLSLPCLFLNPRWFHQGLKFCLFPGGNDAYLMCMPKSNKFLIRKLASVLWYPQLWLGFLLQLIIENPEASPNQTLSVVCIDFVDSMPHTTVHFSEYHIGLMMFKSGSQKEINDTLSEVNWGEFNERSYSKGVQKAKRNQQRMMKYPKADNNRGAFITLRPKGTSGKNSYWNPERNP